MDASGGKRQKITDWLLEQIRGNVLQEGKRIPSEYDLAERFHVNKMTANAAVEELVVRGYLERRARGGGTVVKPNVSRFKGSIAVFMGGVESSYYSSLLCGIQEGAHQPESEIPMLWIDKNRIPVVPGELNQLMHDDYLGGQMLASHLYELGHRKILYIAQLSNILSRRFDGFRDELDRHSLPLLAKESYFRSGLLPSEFLRRLLKRFPEATAIACDGDNVAFEFYWSLKEMGLRVPEDISLTGFSGFPEVQRLIRLTTVDEHPHRIGFYAAELLISILEKRTAEPVHEVFGVEFLHGATTAPPRVS